MNKLQQAKNYDKLQAIWKKKLKDSGFNDIEDDKGEYLKSYSTSMNNTGKLNGVSLKDRISSRAATENYYRLAGQFLHEYKFADALEKKIWEMHSDGLSHRTIAKQLRNTDYLANKDKINKIIKGLATKMLKNYREEDNYE